MKKISWLLVIFGLFLCAPTQAGVWDTVLKTINGSLGFSIEDGGTNRLVIDSTGKVGIGTSSPTSMLDVAGGIKVGTTSILCDSVSEGAIRYSTTDNQMQFCNGTGWKAFFLNLPPTVSNVSMSGTLQSGNTLTGSYTYADTDNDSQGASLFQWFRADDTGGTNEVAISGATNSTYLLTPDEGDKYVRFEVTPVAATGTKTGTADSAWSSNTIIGQVDPSNLSLSHSSRNRYFNVSWTAGETNGGSGGCKLQYKNGGSWYDISSATSINCDANASSQSYSLNGDGWKSGWNGTQVRLVRKSDGVSMGTFPQTLNCSSTGGSGGSTPNVDEDCNGSWNNTSQSCSTTYDMSGCTDMCKSYYGSSSYCTGDYTGGPCGGNGCWCKCQHGSSQTHKWGMGNCGSAPYCPPYKCGTPTQSCTTIYY